MITKILVLGLASIADVFWGRKPMIGAIASSPFNASFTLQLVSRIFIPHREINVEMKMEIEVSLFDAFHRFRFVFAEFHLQKD